jgi:peptide/nickel transport system substrate-binding protein
MRTTRRWISVLVLATLTVAACGSGAEQATPTGDEAAETEAGKPTTASNVLVDLPTLPVSDSEIDTDATMRVAFAFVESTLDPHKVRQNYLTTYLYDTLFQVDKDKNLTPGIGTDFEFSPDLRSVDITLRSDATFADGTPVDAEAVRQSLERGRTLADSTVKGSLAKISAINVVDPQHITLNLSEPDVTIMYTLAGHAGAVINPEAIAAGTDLGTTPAGSTPYDLVSFDPGKKFVVAHRPGATYWDPAAFKLGRIEISTVTDPNTVMNGLQTGEFEMGKVVLSEDQIETQLGSDFNTVVQRTDSVIWLFLRDTRPVFTDQAVREAFVTGIDRETIAANVLDQCPPTSQIFPEGSPAYIDDYAPFAYDPDEAESLLNGASPSVEVIVAPTQTNEVKIAEIAQQQLGDIGLTVTITPFNLPEATPQFVSGNRDAFIQGSSPLPDPAQTIEKFWLGPNALAGPELKPQVVALMQEANALPLGSPERTAKLQDLHRLALDSATGVPVCRIAHFYAMVDGLEGLEDNPTGWAGYFSAKYMYMRK